MAIRSWIVTGLAAASLAAGAPAPAGVAAQELQAAPGEARLSEPVPFDSATAVRYLEAGRRLAAAVATDDAPAFRALHTDGGWDRADDWWRAMLADQKRSFGSVVRAHGPFRGSIRSGRMGAGIPPAGAAVLLRFERDAGAALSYTLDDSGRIASSSLWVLRELAAADTAGAQLLWAAPPGSKP